MVTDLTLPGPAARGNLKDRVPPRGLRTRGAVPGVRQDGPQEAVMAWVILVLSGVLEAVWATALGRSEGFTRLAPSVVFGVTLVISAMRYDRRARPKERSALRR